MSNGDIRDTLFGDLPFARWLDVPEKTLQLEPWVAFARAKQSADAGETRSAVSALRSVLAMPDLESRHYLQAYHFLRELGVSPGSDAAKRLLGVVVEAGMPQGVDLVAAYADRRARYYNYSGAAVIWECPNDVLDEPIDALLQAGREVVAKIGPWEEARRPAPSNGRVRLNFLTPVGLHFGEGAMEVLARDPLGGPVISAAIRLMQQLMGLTKK